MPGLDEFCVLSDGEIRTLVFIVNDPALTLGNDFVAKFLCGEFISPLAECTLGEFLNVAFVNEGDGFSFVIESMLNGHAHQALGAGYGNGFDADAGIEADLLLATF